MRFVGLILGAIAVLATGAADYCFLKASRPLPWASRAWDRQAAAEKAHQASVIRMRSMGIVYTCFAVVAGIASTVLGYVY